MSVAFLVIISDETLIHIYIYRSMRDATIRTNRIIIIMRSLAIAAVFVASQ